ncbi:hypothetical protein B0J12DRAFT_739895 [Macrophomina phaseolina]|uniref:Armadillo-like helical n=1 Tax=Macrophomina phaseolina TaxID=35725 RepID=A0ABQ8GDF0_9PEZI|nr:hypothetical protein B0J12DRAFT_739895 [Macrophomina phaseolina]
MKRNGNITNFFKPFTEPKETRALSEERRERGSSFPSLSVLDSDRRPRWPSIDQTKERPVPLSTRHRDILSPTPPPPLETKPTPAPQPPTGVYPPQNDMTNRNTGSVEPGSSFNSSFSSLPQQSQSSTSSKRVVKDGVPLVRTSDSEEEDSDSELEDLTTILNKKRRAQALPENPNPTMKPKRDREGPGSAYDLRSHFKRAPPKREFKSIVAPTRKYKISLSDLVTQRQKGLDSEARVLEAQRQAEEAERAAEESKAKSKISKEGLRGALGDAEGVERTFNALQRTEVLETDQVWRFFEKNDETVAPARPQFPAPCLSEEGWQRRLIDPSTRDGIFISGIVKSRIYKQPLPDELLIWMIDDLCQSRKEELTNAYFGILESSTPQLRKILTRQAISDLFRRLGAREEAVSFSSELPEILPDEVNPHEPKKALPHGSSQLIGLLRRAAPFLETTVIEYTLEVLIRLSFDDSTRQDGDIQWQCQEAIAAMLDALSSEDEPEVLRRVSQTLFQSFRNHGPKEDKFVNHVLQAQLVQAIPSITRREATFQRRLALAFFLDSPKPLTLSLTAPGILPAILQSLVHNPLFRFSRGTDYADVTAAFTLLDIAIDSGFSDRAFASTLRSIDRRTRDIAARQLREAARAAEDEFNLGVDALTATIRRIMGQIRGSGTESVRMSEAKGAMERLVYRLESSVRTREKSGTDIFATDARRSAGLMESWVGGTAGSRISSSGGGKGGGGIEEVNRNAPDEEEHGKVKREPDGEGAEEVAT